MLKELLDKEDWGIQFEFTAPGTPQQNGVVERAFATLYGRVRAMLNGAQLEEKLRHSLWAECANTATDLINMMVTDGDKLTPYEKLYGKKPKHANCLRTFGEVAIVKKSEFQQIKPKLENRGIIGLFMGYSPNHAEGVYRFYCPETKGMRISRDIKWLGKTYKAYQTAKESGDIEDPQYVTVETDPKDINDQNNITPEELTISNEPNPTTTNTSSRPSGLDRILRELHTSYNPTMETVAWALMTKNIESDDIPQTFQQAWHHKNKEKREAWRTAIRKEFSDMNNRGVWRKVKRDNIPQVEKL